MTVLHHKVMEQFSRAARRYDAQALFQREQVAWLYRRALAEFEEKAQLADIGCGTGYFIQLAAAKRPQWNILGLDLAFGMCLETKKRGIAIQADATALPLADGVCDGVVSSLCLQWVTDLPAACAEIARVLAPGGRAVLVTLAEQSLRELRRVASDVPIRLLTMHPAEAYETALAAQGLRVIDRERVPEIRYYPSVRALLDSMRAIGAGGNFTRREKGFTSARRWRAMLANYEKLRMAEGIPATWDRLMLVVEKVA